MSKPIAQFSGEDGNIFMLVGIACKALKGAGLSEDAKEMKKLALHANSYRDAIEIMGEYVTIV